MTKQHITTKPATITDQELDHVTGGIGLLLPAVQKVREAASADTVPAEDFSLNFEQIKFEY